MEFLITIMHSVLPETAVTTVMKHIRTSVGIVYVYPSSYEFVGS